MPFLEPHLDILPAPQRLLWAELHAVPADFTLYGGTALALRLGHRQSIDFDFFSATPFDPDELARTIPFLNNAERLQVNANTLTCHVQRGGPVLVSFFGGLNLGVVEPPDTIKETGIHVASLKDIAGSKAAVIQKRAEAKDYLDIDALVQNGIDLPTMLAAGRVLYGPSFNPMITLKALSYFEDVPSLPAEVKTRLIAAVAAVDPAQLPALSAFKRRAEQG